ncbi:doubled CXXCH motif [bacterium BMS3Bbin14]|nr:doubled CXXCH motif [bacterium BMS3Bbin14]
MMMRGSTYVWIAVALGLAALPVCGRASVHGPCSDCHTMHNSQGGLPMTYSAGFGTTGGSFIPNDTLLRGNCLACHTGVNNGNNTTPYVYTTSLPTYGLTGNTLAGGNFYWCVNGGGTGAGVVAVGGGHNVDMLGVSASATLTSPPGDSDATSWATRVGNQTDMASGGHLTCAGTAGCHGDRTKSTNLSAMWGDHHNTPNSTSAASFRFLKGVTGTEDPDWEYQPDSTHHNEYKGADRSDDSVVDPTTISSLCAQCHGAFHNSNGTYINANGVTVTAGIASTPGTMVSPWIRHPTDYDMNHKGGSTEYAAYTTYDPMVPVGHKTLNGTTSDATAYGDSGGAIVMCLSCHRAHGSPYASLLRWNYKAWPGSTAGYYGCATCHTTKN